MTRPNHEDERTAAEFDPTSPEHRSLGRGLFEENMGPGSAVAHLYRGEVHRMEAWRQRLDRTTYWAVTVIAATLTWAFSSRTNPHYLVLVAIAVLTVFLGIEARRFRGYDIWRSRVRSIQRNVFAYGLDPSRGVSDEGWRKHLSRNYRLPETKIGYEESIAHRLRRVYLWLFLLLLAAWIVRITGFATQPWPASASVALVPGSAVTGGVGLLYLAMLFVAYRPREWHAEREIDGRESDLWNRR